MRTISATAQAAGWPWPLNLPCRMMKSTVAAAKWFSWRKRRGPVLDQAEQPVAAGRNMRAVLDVARPPESLGGDIVALVERGIERVQHDPGAVIFGRRVHG